MLATRQEIGIIILVASIALGPMLFFSGLFLTQDMTEKGIDELIVRKYAAAFIFSSLIIGVVGSVLGLFLINPWLPFVINTYYRYSKNKDL